MGHTNSLNLLFVSDDTKIGFGGESIFLFESAKKVGVISEASLEINFADRKATLDVLLRKKKAFLNDVTMGTDIGFLFEQVRKIIFINKKRVGQTIQRKIFGQMSVNIGDCFGDGRIAFWFLKSGSLFLNITT